MAASRTDQRGCATPVVRVDSPCRSHGARLRSALRVREVSGAQSVPHPDSILAALRDAAEHTPDAVLLWIGESSFTYAEALANVSAVAAGIRSLGIEPGERVGIMAPNAPETVWSWLGTNAAQAVDVHFNADARGAFLA